MNVREQIHSVSLETLDAEHPMVDYADGDVAFIDHVKGLHAIRPLSPRMNTVLLCCSGSIAFKLNGRREQLNRGDVLVAQPNVVLTGYTFSRDFECKILCLSERITAGLLQRNIAIWNRAVYVDKQNIFSLPPTDAETLGHYYELVCALIKDESRAFRVDIIQSILRAMLLDLCGLVNRRIADIGERTGAQGELVFERFLSLLSTSTVKRRPVAAYASEMCVSAKYLTTCCLHYSNRPASKWIEEAVVEDIRFYLRNTRMSVKEVSVALGFPNVSFFGTYVRRHLGVSPRAYRNN